MQRLLLIGNHEGLSLLEPFQRAGYETQTVRPDRSEELWEAFHAFQPDALIVQLGTDTLLLQHVRRVLREELNSHPIPLLALARLPHLDPPQLVVGVDDFILPPYDPEELLARIQMLLWRYRRINAQHCIQSDGLVLDLARRSVTEEGRVVPLTVREFGVLQFLMAHRERTLTRETLLAKVWGCAYEGDLRVVDTTIKRLRAKLSLPYRDRIETVRGVGYRFI